jgi:hypothetical protein
LRPRGTEFGTALRPDSEFRCVPLRTAAYRAASHRRLSLGLSPRTAQQSLEPIRRVLSRQTSPKSGPRYDRRMRRILTLVLRVASVPVGVGAGLWTASLWVNTAAQVCSPLSCVSGPRFATWQCALFGAAVTLVLLLLSSAGSLQNALRVLSVPVAVGVGLSAASPWVVSGQGCGGMMCAVVAPRFALWQCALFGAGAAVVVLLLSLAVTRLPRAGQLKAA